jgi:hypothetical protein
MRIDGVRDPARPAIAMNGQKPKWDATRNPIRNSLYSRDVRPLKGKPITIST